MHAGRTIGSNREIPERFHRRRSGLGRYGEHNAIQFILPFDLAGQPRVWLYFAALAFERRQFEFRLRLQRAQPGFFDEDMAGSALAAAAAKCFDRQSGLPKYLHESRAIAGIDLVLRAIAICCENSCQAFWNPC